MSLSSDEGRFVGSFMALSSIVSAVRRARLNTEVGWIRPGPIVPWCAVGTEQWRIQGATPQTIKNIFIHNLAYQFLIDYGEWNLLKRLKSSGVAMGGTVMSKPPLMFRPFLRLTQIRWNVYRLYRGVPVMYILTFTAHKQRKIVRSPNFRAGNATV